MARHIVKDIVRQGRQPGAALAPEMDMLEEYAASRESLREAMRLLEVQGLVRMRRGPGGGPDREPSRCDYHDPRALGRDIGDDHRRIAVAIVAGGAEQASALMKEHIGGVAQVASDRLGPRLDDLIEWH